MAITMVTIMPPRMHHEHLFVREVRAVVVRYASSTHSRHELSSPSREYHRADNIVRASSARLGFTTSTDQQQSSDRVRDASSDLLSFNEQCVFADENKTIRGHSAKSCIATRHAIRGALTNISSTSLLDQVSFARR